MKPIKLFALLILTVCSTALSAQVGDCAGAQLLETKEDVTFIFNEKENQFTDVISPTCEGANEVFSNDAGVPSHWFTWTIAEPGSLYFTISMDFQSYDLDFILFKSASKGNSCTDKEAIRCMFSGESSEFPSSPCFGETGLNPIETDLFENAGCLDGSNNFLKQIDAEAGEEYKLIIIDFSQIEGMEILLEMCGTATLGVNDTPCVTSAIDDLSQTENFDIFPNPTSDQLFLSNNNVPTIINFPYTIVDQLGQVILRKDDNSILESIETSSLKSGIYFININEGKSKKVMKFVKQ
jgi:hypothetical protein